MDHSAVKEMIRSILPPLESGRHKGQAGRIGIIGGSEEYTGAPFFAAISAMRLGADQAHVYCAKDAAVAIKSYSPDLIVLPFLDAESGVEKISQQFERLNALVIGPGLGRAENILKVVEELIRRARKSDLPLVLDADSLWLVNQKLDLVHSYGKAVLTPNVVEAERLFKALGLPGEKFDKKPSTVKDMAAKMGNLCIVVKGPSDVVSDGVNVLECHEEGGLKRCGGQGDIMAGMLATCLNWTHQAAANHNANALLRKFGPTMCAVAAASLLTRRSARTAFSHFGRSLVSEDILASIPETVRWIEHSPVPKGVHW